MSAIQLKSFTGAALHEYLEEVARLRIEVFREYPYLYDGSMEYESRYLQTYVRCEQAVVVVAFDGKQVIGASTGIPLQFEEENFKRPFLEQGYDPAGIFYCAESVLLGPWRGRGIGVQFFSEREAHARALGGFDRAAFCAVVRPPDHPLRPADYKPLDRFWTRRGYARQPELRARLEWKDIDQHQPTVKNLEFWLKSFT